MKTLALTASLALVLVACGGGAPPAAEPKASGETAGPPGWPTLGQGEARFIRIDMGPDNFEECRKATPKFPFDSAVTFAQDREHLAAFAACMNSAGMKERTLELVGRADPQGTDGHNDELGMKRAEAIKQILIENGLDAGRISVATAGEKGAQGDTAEQSSGHDRRVDIVVKGGTHSP